MRVLTTTMCYPTPKEPERGIFIQRRALAIAGLGHHVEVVSPQPWCPLLRANSTCPDQCEPLPATFPRMFSIPIVGWATDGFAYARALEQAIRKANPRGTPGLDLIDAHFEYPDGVGAALAAGRLGLPVVVTVRGKIVSLSKRAGRRAQIRAMLRNVDAIVAVSESLARCVRHVAGDDLQVDVIPNGIDTSTFRPLDRAECRQSLGWDPHAGYILSVGHLQRLKGFDRLVAVWSQVRAACGDVRLVLAGSRRGESDFASRLLADIERANRNPPSGSSPPAVEFVGPQPPDRLNLMYNAADLVASTSRSEGWCNAIAESLAVGSPVVATDVGGNREQIHSSDLGTLVPDGDADVLTTALIQAIRRDWNRPLIASVGSRRTWEHAAREVESVFKRVISARHSSINCSARARSFAATEAAEAPGSSFGFRPSSFSGPSQEGAGRRSGVPG